LLQLSRKDVDGRDKPGHDARWRAVWNAEAGLESVKKTYQVVEVGPPPGSQLPDDINPTSA